MSNIPMVSIETSLGPIIVELYPEQAPISVNNFITYVDRGLFNSSSIFRIVTEENACQPEDSNAQIQVVQCGLPPGHPSLLAPIAHENTRDTTILHEDGVISMARFEPGTADGSFFFCVGDQPELDYGGKRYPDGLGFAAFGRIIRGQNILNDIYGHAEDNEYLCKEIPILSIRLL